MDEYIVRSYIRKMAMLEMAYTMETETDAAVVLRMIDDAPAADVAPVVRCEGCKHRIYKYVNSWIGEIGGCNIFNHPMPNDAFCSYGERKDGGDG